MARTGILEVSALALLTACLGVGQVQPPVKSSPPASPSVVTIEEPNAQRTKDELARLLEHYPPTLRNVLSIDPSLLSNQAFLAPYPALSNFLNAHPEIPRSPSFYVGDIYSDRRFNRDQSSESSRAWERVAENLFIVVGFGMAFGVVTWLIRTIMDYRRWKQLSKVQTEIHTRLLDRFTSNEELLAYIQSPAGSKFLESSPITLDPAPRSLGAPLARILWSVQAGLVSMAVGVGLQAMAGRFNDDASQPVRAFGILGIALGLGFVISAIISFVISQRLGLIEMPARPPETSPTPPTR
jgi:hypothetical protein